MAPRLIGQMNGILFALGSRPVAGAMVGIQERESGGAWGCGTAYASGRAAYEVARILRDRPTCAGAGGDFSSACVACVGVRCGRS